MQSTKAGLCMAFVAALATVAFVAIPAQGRAGGPTDLDRAARAIAAARGAAGGGSAYDIETERRAGARTWEVKVATGPARALEVEVSRSGKTVLSRRDLAHPDAEADASRSVEVGLIRALRLADRHAGGRLDEAELDRERGRLVWSVTFRSGAGEREVEIDADSGAFLGADADD